MQLLHPQRHDTNPSSFSSIAVYTVSVEDHNTAERRRRAGPFTKLRPSVDFKLKSVQCHIFPGLDMPFKTGIYSLMRIKQPTKRTG